MLFPLKKLVGKVREGMGLKIKSLKCSACGIKVNAIDEEIELALASCKNKYREDYKSCALKHLVEFTKNINDRQAGKPKQVPRILQPGARDYSESDSYVDRSQDDVTGGHAYDDYPDWSLLNSRPSSHHQIKTLAINREKGEFEFEVDDPIVIFIHKNGRVDLQSFEK